jgi:hypothetical protein
MPETIPSAAIIDATGLVIDGYRATPTPYGDLKPGDLVFDVYGRHKTVQQVRRYAKRVKITYDYGWEDLVPPTECVLRAVPVQTQAAA